MALPRGKIGKPPKILEIRKVTNDDMGKLLEPRRKTRIEKFRAAHHMVARMIAMGFSDNEICEASGYSHQRIWTLKTNPAFKGIIAGYEENINAIRSQYDDEYTKILVSNRQRAELQIADHLDESDDQGELLPLTTLLKIARDAADRTGYGKHTTSTNVHYEMGDRLERAIARSGKTIEGRAVPSTPVRVVEHKSLPDSPAPAEFKRRF